MKKLLILTLLTISNLSFALSTYLTHVKSSSPNIHVMKYQNQFVIVETGDLCLIPAGIEIRLTQYGSSRGYLRGYPANSRPIECAVLSARYMKNTVVSILRNDERGLHFKYKNKYYRISSLAECDYLEQLSESELWYDHAPTDYTSILVNENKSCLKPSITVLL